MKADIEEFPIIQRFVVSLWKVKTLRDEYFYKQVGDLIAATNEDLTRTRAADTVRFLKGLLSDLELLRGVAVKVNLKITTSDAFSCEPPAKLYLELPSITQIKKRAAA